MWGPRAGETQNSGLPALRFVRAIPWAQMALRHPPLVGFRNSFPSR